MPKLRALVAIASASAAGVLGVLPGACAANQNEEPVAVAAGTASIVSVLDGDTIVADIAGAKETVRLIGIDTPETVSPSRPVECFGAEASARAKALLPTGTVVRLERDVEARDRYDRLLAYVIRDHDDLLVNLLLVEEGYAESKAFPPNTARQDQLDQAEAGARAAERGLWPACGGTNTPVGPVASAP